MKLKSTFTIYNISDEYMLIPVGEEMKSFGGTIILNDVSAFLLEQMKEDHKTKDELVDALLSEYIVDRATAEKDVAEAIAAFEQYEVLE